VRIFNPKMCAFNARVLFGIQGYRVTYWLALRSVVENVRVKKLHFKMPAIMRSWPVRTKFGEYKKQIQSY